MKGLLHIDLDLTGNHGLLIHEVMRFLDSGAGQHGVTFELTEDQFKLLQKKCETIALEQEDAIKEAVISNKFEKKSSDQTMIYPYEHCSLSIFAAERAKAKQEKREPRLKSFEITLSLDSGLSLEKSHTCKTIALLLLEDVLTKEQIQRLTEQGKHPAIPKHSGHMEDIYLHTSGPLRQHKKKSGEIVFYRDVSDPEVKLYWTLPPQELDPLSKDTLKQFKISETYLKKVKISVSQLQRLEWLLRNSVIPKQLDNLKQEVINQMIGYYQEFALLSLITRDNVDKEMTKKLQQVDEFFMDCYNLAISCSRSLDDKPLGLVITYLPQKDKQMLCKILGRTYIEESYLCQNGNSFFRNPDSETKFSNVLQYLF